MKPRLFLSALFKFRNLIVLLIGVSSVYLAINLLLRFLEFVPDMAITGLYGAAFLVYLGFAIQSVMDEKFREEFKQSEKVRQLRRVNALCRHMEQETRRYLQSTYQQKLRRVMQDKEDILNSFLRGERNYLKEKIAEQTLNLVQVYMKLLKNYCIRSRELAAIDLSDVVGRINANRRKLNFIRDPEAAENVKRLVEMDERVVERVKDEKMELEKVSAKLEFMESTISAFKHQVFSNIETEEMVEQLDSTIREAEALESVLEERQRKNRAIL